jgi:N-acetylmuramoyl-L-alanine amidase
VCELRICLDAGHGGDDPGCMGNGKNERDLTLEYTFEIKKNLEKYQDVVIFMTRSADEAFSLRERANNANVNRCDLFVSCHLNAFNREARGTEVIHSIYATQEFIKFCKALCNNVAWELGIPVRRTFSKQGENGDYYGVIRYTTMPAIILEALFLDNAEDFKHYNPNLIGKVVAGTIADYYGLKLKQENINIPVPNKVYRVVCGSYRDKNNAEEKVKILKSKGFDSFIVES